MHSHLKFELWLTAFLFAYVHKQVFLFFLFLFQGLRQAFDGLTSCMPMARSSEGCSQGDFASQRGFLAPARSCTGWWLYPLQQHLIPDILFGKSGTWQQRKQGKVFPRLRETRSHLCRGHSILHLTSDASPHYCPRKVLAHLLYNPWGMYSSSLLILFMSHCWDIVTQLNE